MNRMFLMIALALAMPVAQADSGKTQYITDDVSVTLRETPSNDGNLLGVLRSGQKVTLIESLGEQSFARVRTSDGREGWMTARYLSNTPAAKDRLQQLQSDLDTARNEIKSLQDELKSAQARLDKARPAFELSQENDRLKSELSANQAAADAARQQFDHERARRTTLLTGAGLLTGGVVLGLVLPSLMQSRRRRRYGDF